MHWKADLEAGKTVVVNGVTLQLLGGPDHCSLKVQLAARRPLQFDYSNRVVALGVAESTVKALSR